MSKKYTIGSDLDCKYLDTLIYVSTLVGVFVCVDQVYHMCPIIFIVFKILADFVILDMKEFVMSWEKLVVSFSTILYNKGVLRIQRRLCMPQVGNLILNIHVEAHNSMNYVHTGANKMYRDLK